MTFGSYVSHTEMNRTANDANPICSQALVGGYSPDIDFIVVLHLMALTVQEGLL
jgi:hypothetical protein